MWLKGKAKNFVENRNHHLSRLPKRKSQERNLKLKVALQVEEHDPRKLLKGQYLYLIERERETLHVSQYYSTGVSGPQTHHTPKSPFKSQYYY